MINPEEVDRIITEFPIIKILGGEFVSRFHDTNHLELQFSMTYYNEDISFGSLYEVYDEPRRKESEQFLRQCLRSLEKHIMMPFERLPLCLPISYKAELYWLVEKIIKVRLRYGVS